MWHRFFRIFYRINIVWIAPLVQTWREYSFFRKDLSLLKTAALWHDVGFINKNIGHEEEGCVFVKKYLPDYGYTNSEIEIICGLIMATKIPQSPNTKLEQIIADANMKSDEMIEQARIKTIEAANEEKAKAKSEIADLINKAADKITNTKSDEKLYDDFLKEMK